jgi:acyl-CoA reductase-like NAD-dependent aldehyde dehydrogenase
MSKSYRFQQFIGGEWVDASNGGTWEVINPATEDVVRTVPFGSREDVNSAIAAAESAFPAWKRMTAWERGAILMKTAALIRERIEELFPHNIAESGKTIEDAKGDLLAGAALFEWFAEEGKRASGRTLPARKPGKRMMVLKQPLGVVGVITAWNFPAYNPARSWAAALAAGCTVVARPSEYTPLTAMLMANLLEEAGLPKGVLNLVNGDPDAMGQAMLDHPALRKISFTGSVRVGKILMDGASRNIKRLALELGGNAPVIVFPDADLEFLQQTSVMAKFRCTGQVCISPQRFIVHSKIHDEFVERLAPQVAALRVGNGADPSTQLGPMINARQRDRVEEIVRQARTEGVEVHAGGRRPEHLDRGYFYSPTLVSGVTPKNNVFAEEIFGPVLPVSRFDEVEQVISLANATPYGLAAYVWTNHLPTAVKCYEGLEFGMVGVNEWVPQSIEGPFGGWKQSGIGHECGSEGLEEYLETKLVGIGGIN